MRATTYPCLVKCIRVVVVITTVLMLVFIQANVACALILDCTVTQRWNSLPQQGSITQRNSTEHGKQFLQALGPDWMWWPSFSFNDKIGELQWRSSAGILADPIRFKVIGEGSRNNDLLAVRDGECAASCNYDLLRIRSWDGPTSFSFMGGNGTLVVGHCKP